MGLKEDLDMEQVLAIEPKKRRRLASSGYSSLAELKKALGVTDGSDAAPDGSKRIKFEDGAGESAARVLRHFSAPVCGAHVGSLARARSSALRRSLLYTCAAA